MFSSNKFLTEKSDDVIEGSFKSWQTPKNFWIQGKEGSEVWNILRPEYPEFEDVEHTFEDWREELVCSVEQVGKQREFTVGSAHFDVIYVKGQVTELLEYDIKQVCTILFKTTDKEDEKA